MTLISTAPDISGLDAPMDAWTRPFWEAAEGGQLLLPRCGECRRFRWPPGPFCRHCQSQNTEWLAPGRPRLYSFTVIPASRGADESRVHVPALVEFADAAGIHLPAAIVDTPISALQIGAALVLGWAQARNVKVPVFTIAGQ